MFHFELDRTTIAHMPENSADIVKHLDRALTNQGCGSYNRVCATVAKAKNEGFKGALALTPAEINDLSLAYSYLHAQRFTRLFDECHEGLWQIFEASNETRQLLKLFRHSSFVWRIRGDSEKEKEYLARLKEKQIGTVDANDSPIIVIEFGYYMRRLRMVFA